MITEPEISDETLVEPSPTLSTFNSEASVAPPTVNSDGRDNETLSLDVGVARAGLASTAPESPLLEDIPCSRSRECKFEDEVDWLLTCRKV